MRPGRGSRPRTKLRPAHTDAVTGLVTTVDRGRYTCLVEGRTVIAMRARELHREQIVVGDRVDVVGDTSGAEGTLARVVRIAPRRSVLRRSADDTDPAERIVAANADALLIVVAAADPPPRTGFIDRCLVAAYADGMEALLLITKTDLADPGAWVERYSDLDLPIIRSGWAEPDGTDPGEVEIAAGALARIRTLLAGRMTALIGHSGVGKSTLVNALAGQRVALVADVAGTTRDHVGALVNLGGLVVRWVDTPGIDERISDGDAITLATQVIARADLIVHCIDPDDPGGALDPRLAPAIDRQTPVIRAGTRADLGEHRAGTDVRLSVTPKASRGLETLVGLARSALVPPAALADPTPWRFWDSINA